jgi:hypothetical protein
MCDFGQIWLLFPALCMKRGKKDGAAGRKIEKRTRKNNDKNGKKNSRIVYVPERKTVVKCLVCFVQ